MDYKEKAKNEQLARQITKDNLAYLLGEAKSNNVGLVHVFDPDYPMGGLSVAFRKSSPYKSGVMVEVAVATCSTQDMFNKKVGATIALQMFFDGKTIEFPLLKMFTEDNLNYAVKQAFNALYYAV